MAVGSIGLEGPFARGVSVPTSGVSIENLAVLAEMLARGEFDLAGVGRAMLANPAWASLVETGRFEDLVPYNPASIAHALEPAAI
jgi:2,4-dienoyl-CoA reductase-like NADH-dependent reductase (Old Yellow Enzyme family)